jgi:hypothetical protein
MQSAHSSENSRLESQASDHLFIGNQQRDLLNWDFPLGLEITSDIAEARLHPAHDEGGLMLLSLSGDDEIPG